MTDRKLRVFLCHASQDKSVVRELYQRLLAEIWIDPWLDEEKILPGQDWDMEIEKAVETADAVIVCLSNNSISKEGYIQKEIKKVLDISERKPEESIFIIPLRLEESIPPRQLAKWEYLDYFPKDRLEAAYRRLLKSLELKAISIGDIEHTVQVLSICTICLRDLRYGEVVKCKKCGALYHKDCWVHHGKCVTQGCHSRKVEYFQSDYKSNESEDYFEKGLREKESEAIKYELVGDYWNALQVYYVIKKIDPSFPRVDIKINEMEREVSITRLGGKVVICPKCHNDRSANLGIPCAHCGARKTIFGYQYLHEFKSCLVTVLIGLIALAFVVGIGITVYLSLR